MNVAATASVHAVIESALQAGAARQQVGMAVMDNALETATQQGQALLEVLPPPVTPGLGGNVDVYA